jgi:hypothetical protein
MRRAFWAMGGSSRIDVKLSALVPPHTKNKAGVEEWTDLDVVGVQYVPLMGLVFVVADCKTQRQRATEQVFWLKGVADLFRAQNAYLVRDADLPPAARQLSLRLGVAAMGSADRRVSLDQAGTARLPKTGHFLEGDASAGVRPQHRR